MSASQEVPGDSKISGLAFSSLVSRGLGFRGFGV